MIPLSWNELSSDFRIRSWRDFLNSHKFKPPSAKDLPARVQHNLVHWGGNYLVLAAVVFFVFMFFKPWSLLAISFVVVAGYYMFVLHPSLVIGGIALNLLHKLLILSISGGILMYLTSGLMIVWVVGISSGVILLHAIFRVKSLKSKVGTLFDTAASTITGTPIASTPIEMTEIITESVTDTRDEAMRQESQRVRENYHQLHEQMKDKYQLKRGPAGIRKDY